jgi:nucleoside-diphosphate-sugar epimerase
MTRKRALVTGATGFVGSHLSRALIRESWEVHAVVRQESKLEPLKDITDTVKVHSHDGNAARLAEIIEDSRPDVVFHLASQFIVEHKPEEVENLITSNILLGTYLAEAMSVQGVRYLVNTGTSWQHFENRDYDPVNLYAATKQAFEAILSFYVNGRGLRIITLKLFDTYGPNDPRPKIFTLLSKMMTRREPLAMSPGDQLLDLTYIDDVVDAYLCAANRLLAGRVLGHEQYAVSSGRTVSLRELVAIFQRETMSILPVQWGGRPYRQREVMVPWDRGAPLPGWQPRVSLAEGLKKLAAWKGDAR